MSDAALLQWNYFLNKLTDPSLTDQLGADLEAAKELVRSWANTNLKPLVASETVSAAALRASAAAQAAEASALRQRLATFEPTNPTAQNVKRVMENHGRYKRGWGCAIAATCKPGRSARINKCRAL